MRKILTIVLFTFFSPFTLADTDYEDYKGYVIKEFSSYPIFLGECHALLKIFYTLSEENKETYRENFNKYAHYMARLKNYDDLKASHKASKVFFNAIIKKESLDSQAVNMLYSDLNVCAYHTSLKEQKYSQLN